MVDQPEAPALTLARRILDMAETDKGLSLNKLAEEIERWWPKEAAVPKKVPSATTERYLQDARGWISAQDDSRRTCAQAEKEAEFERAFSRHQITVDAYRAQKEQEHRDRIRMREMTRVLGEG